MIDLRGNISIAFLKKSRFTGSYRGMRYQLQKSERKTDTKGTEVESQEAALLATIWPEPFSYEVTSEEKKHSKEFSFSQEGIWEAVAWLNEEYKSGNF